MNEQEERAIDALQRCIQKHWPPSLMLFASAGSLYALRESDYKEGLDLDRDGVRIVRVHADGGRGDI